MDAGRTPFLGTTIGGVAILVAVVVPLARGASDGAPVSRSDDLAAKWTGAPPSEDAAASLSVPKLANVLTATAESNLTGGEIGATGSAGAPGSEPVVTHDFVDALTGDSLLARRVESKPGDGEAGPGLRRVEVPTVARRRERLRGDDARFDVDARSFPWTPTRAGTISPLATSWRVVVPLHREADVRIRAVLASGAPSTTTIDRWALEGEPEVWDPRTEAMRDGGLRLLGVPWFPGRRLTIVTGSTPPGVSNEIVEKDGVCALPEPATWSGRLPEAPDASLEVRVAVNESEASATTCCCEPWEQRASRDPGPPVAEPPAGRGGSARIRLVDADGVPRAGVELTIGGRPTTTDADGWTPPVRHVSGSHDVRVPVAGARYEPASVLVADGATARLELREPVASILDVRVVDSEGRPRPFAQVELDVPAGDWCDLDDAGVQRLDPWTDRYGARTCRNVPAGHVTVRASAGGVMETVDVECRAGSRDLVRIVVP